MEFDPNKTAAYLAGKIDEYVKQQARDTIMQNVEHDRFARYARIPDGKACDFCKMLGSRGFVYHSAAKAGDREKGGESFHPFCNCQIAVSFDPAMRFYYKGITKVSRGYDSSSPVDIDELFEQYVASGKSYTSGSRYRDYMGRKASKLTAERFASYQDQLVAATSLEELHAVGDRIVAEWNPGRGIRDKKQWDQLSRYAKRLEKEMSSEHSKALRQEARKVVMPESYKGNYDDFLPLDISGETRSQLNELRRLASENGYEYAQIIRDGVPGEIITSNSPNEVLVKISAEDGYGLSLLHSHTNETPLSARDFRRLCSDQVDCVGNATINGDAFLAKIGNGWRPTVEEYDRIVSIISDEVDRDVAKMPEFANWSPFERNYVAIREQTYRIARHFEWDLMGGDIDG